MIEQKERARKEREEEEKKQKVLEDAFASDDEVDSHASSEWSDEQEAVCQWDDEE